MQVGFAFIAAYRFALNVPSLRCFVAIHQRLFISSQLQKAVGKHDEQLRGVAVPVAPWDIKLCESKGLGSSEATL